LASRYEQYARRQKRNTSGLDGCDRDPSLPLGISEKDYLLNC